jgi:hypothetical protein
MAAAVLASPLALQAKLDAALAALRALHRVCANCDLEHPAQRPTEGEYQAAMDAAEKVLGL